MWRLFLIAIFSFLTPNPVFGQTLEHLQAQLAAQKEINALLKERIRRLEVELANSRPSSQTPVPLSDVTTPPSGPDPEIDRALERALVRRGTAVLPPATWEITPSFAWSHSGSSALFGKSNAYSAALDIRRGFSNGWMLAARLPYLKRNVQGIGSNAGPGDISIGVFKELLSQGRDNPSLVANLRYSHPTGEHFGDDPVLLGSGARSLSAGMSVVKSFDPIAYFGALSYSHSFQETIGGLDVDRAGVFGASAGATLAVTPDISVTAALSYGFEDETVIDGTKIVGSSRTIGLLELGTGIVLGKGRFLNVTGRFGVTDDSPDATIEVALPIRF